MIDMFAASSITPRSLSFGASRVNGRSATADGNHRVREEAIIVADLHSWDDVNGIAQSSYRRAIHRVERHVIAPSSAVGYSAVTFTLTKNYSCICRFKHSIELNRARDIRSSFERRDHSSSSGPRHSPFTQPTETLGSAKR